jgi:MYXO-CTERM domain-containing protein
MQVIPSIGPSQVYLGTTTIIYMNKSGATLTPGTNDSRTNRSSVVGQTSAIPAFEGTATEWNNIMTCVRTIFAPYDVQITDVDPGNVPHVESLMGGRAQAAGMPQGVLGVSPFTVDCSVIPNPIVFTFTQSTRDAYGSSPALAEEICEIAAQEIAHSFGLDHELLASDPMTYLNYNGLKTFQNVDAQCGESQARTCGLPGTGVVCSQRQNSVTMLTQRIGLSDTLAPDVRITSPANGATVPTAFAVSADAMDNNAVSKVELYVDGQLANTLTAAPFTFQLSGLALGGHTITAKAYDSRNTTDAVVNVTVANGAEPPEPGDPVDPTDPTDPDDTDGDGRSDVITGGCSTGASGAGGGMLLLGFAAAVGLVRRRRRG